MKKDSKKKDNVVPVKIKKHKDKNGGHYHIITDSVKDKYVSVGLTTQASKGKGKNSGNNYRLEKSPLNDGKVSYLRRQGIVDVKSQYFNSYKGTVTVNDYKVAKKYGDKAKDNYLKKIKK